MLSRVFAGYITLNRIDARRCKTAAPSLLRSRSGSGRPRIWMHAALAALGRIVRPQRPDLTRAVLCGRLGCDRRCTICPRSFEAREVKGETARFEFTGRRSPCAKVAMRLNLSIDTDPQQQKAASPLMLVVRSSSRYVA
jgi:hypothetical protein